MEGPERASFGRPAREPAGAPAWEEAPALVEVAATAFAREVVNRSARIGALTGRIDGLLHQVKVAGCAEWEEIDSLVGELLVALIEVAAPIGARTARHFHPEAIWRQLPERVSEREDWHGRG